jgi:potassium-transporting ATPase KdpC subunit
LAHNGRPGPVPPDAVTTSASGLGPHISPQAALGPGRFGRKSRELPEDRLRALVGDEVERPSFGLSGEPKVNVLLLNFALDRLQSS